MSAPYFEIEQKIIEKEGGRNVIYKKFSVAPILAQYGLTTLGVCLTAENTRLKKILPYGTRLTNKIIAEHLARSVKELADFLADIGVFSVISWVYERHENGWPHIHCLVFIPAQKQNYVAEKIREQLSDCAGAVILYPRAAYLLKEISEAKEEEKEVNFNVLSRKSTFSQDTKKRYKCDKIANVQEKKQIRFCENRIAKNSYQATTKAIKDLIGKIDGYYKTHSRKKSRKHAVSNQEIVVSDFVFYPTSEAEREAVERASRRKGRKKEDRKVKNYEISDIDENGQIELIKHEVAKKQPLEAHLTAANGEKYHIQDKRISITTGEVIELRRKCRKLKSKRALKAFVVAYKTIKIKQEQRPKTRLEELEARKATLEADYALDVELGLEYYIRRYGGEIGRDERVREEHEQSILYKMREQMLIDESNMKRAIRLDLPFWSPIEANPNGEIYYYEKMFAPAKDRPGVFLTLPDWLLDPQRRSIIELDALIDFERRRAANYGAKI
jgi:hypothetical protein|nr:MAG TPA: replication protein A [Caudoviricetes sp.]